MGYKSITKSSVSRHAVVRAASKLMQNQSVASSPQRGFGLTVWIFTKNPGTPNHLSSQNCIYNYITSSGHGEKPVRLCAREREVHDAGLGRSVHGEPAYREEP